MVASKRGLTNQANESGSKIIDPANLAAIGHRFKAKKQKKTKNADARVWGNARRPETWDLLCIENIAKTV